MSCEGLFLRGQLIQLGKVGPTLPIIYQLTQCSITPIHLVEHYKVNDVIVAKNILTQTLYHYNMQQNLSEN